MYRISGKVFPHCSIPFLVDDEAAIRVDCWTIASASSDTGSSLSRKAAHDPLGHQHEIAPTYALNIEEND